MDILDAKRIVVDVSCLDTVETLKKKISEATGLLPCFQTLHVSQNGTKVEAKDDSRIYLGDLIKNKHKAIINLSYKKKNSTTRFYINVVTESGQVVTVTPEGGNSASINDLRRQLSAMLGLPAESLFLRVVELSRFVNKGLATLFNTLEDFCVSSGSVLYLQIHPWNQNWFHGKITRDQAELVMSCASDGQFLVKESVNYPGDYVLFVCIDGKIRHFRVVCKRNMMFTINEQEFFHSMAEMVMFYKNSRGLPTKLTEPVSCSELPGQTSGEGSSTNSSLARSRLQTTASSEIQIRVVVESKAFSLLTNPLNQVRYLKAQIEEISGVPADCQVLRLDGKPLVMNKFLLGDHHIIDNSTIYVQVHPWNEDWYVGKMSHSEIESIVRGMNVADGMFLVRDSTRYPGDYCLYVWWRDKPIQYKVESTKKNQFTIDNSQQFSSLSNLIEYYKSHCGRLKSQLTKPVKIDKELRGLIPPAVLARGNEAKAAYRRALKNGRTCDVRVRIMLIGQNQAGKTSVKRSLKGEKFNQHETSTQGVEMDAPLLKAGIKAWRVHETDETVNLFYHKSAQLIARQLSGPSEDLVESPTRSNAPDLPEEYPARKDPSSNGVKYSKESSVFKELPSPSHILSNGHSADLPRQQSEDDVFIKDTELSDINLPAKVVSLVERILQQEHSALTEEVWPVIWDFSGHSIFHAIHPIFMSREAVYILVSDLSKDLFSRGDIGQPGQGSRMEYRDESSLDHLMRWMDFVHSFQDASTADVSDTAQPPVILVGTHADKVVGDPWKSLNAILNSFHGKSFSSHIVDEKFVVDNTRAGQAHQQEDPNIQRLRQKIISVASTLRHTKREIPLQWLRVEKVVHGLASDGWKYVTKSQFVAIAQRICHFEVDEDSDELLNFLCDCGAVLCFNEAEESNSLVILDPQWLVHLFCQIVTVVSGKKEPMRIREHRHTLAKKGILSEELVGFACKNLDLKLPQPLLLSIMEKSSLVCRLDVHNGKVVYLVPSMLPAVSEEEIRGLIGQSLVAPVYLTFNTGYIPYGLFSRFVVLFAHCASQEHSAKPPQMFANTARLFIGKKNDFSLTFACFKSVIMVHLVREGKEDETEVAAVYHQVCRCVEDILDSLRRQWPWLHSMAWQLCARCDLCVGEADGADGCSWHHVSSCLHPDCAHFIPLDSEPLRCDNTIKLKTWLDENRLMPWLKHFRRNYYPDLLPFKPGHVSHDDLLYLAHDLGLQWRALCRILLGVKEVEHIDHDQKTLFDKCFVTLTRWTHSQGSNATYAALGVALMHEDVLAEDLCKKYCLLESQDVLESSV